MNKKILFFCTNNSRRVRDEIKEGLLDFFANV